ncbi:autotransporter-associated beta strand repeat-containing protein, partial [Salmonella enterica]|nr:autotransporter-associated beta strand repeat-containing protein [Salmonella enterica]
MVKCAPVYLLAKAAIWTAVRWIILFPGMITRARFSLARFRLSVRKTAPLVTLGLACARTSATGCLAATHSMTTILRAVNDELIVTGDNTYSGGTTITGGTLTADYADSLGTGVIANSGVLQVGEGELENTLSGSGSLVKTGTGELTLSGDNSYSGDTTITGGTLTADHADSLGTGVIANSGVLQVGEGELENTLSGSGALVKTGTGELTLSGDNTYSGGTTITGGTLTADHADSLGTGVIANSGVL